MSFRQWTARLAEELGIVGAPAGETLELEFDGFLRCALEPAPDGEVLYLYSMLAAAPTADAEAFYERLMAANGPSAASDGTGFALDALHGQIVLQRMLEPADAASYEALVEALERFVQQAKEWKARLAAPDFAAEVEMASSALDDEEPPPSELASQMRV